MDLEKRNPWRPRSSLISLKLQRFINHIPHLQEKLYQFSLKLAIGNIYKSTGFGDESVLFIVLPDCITELVMQTDYNVTYNIVGNSLDCSSTTHITWNGQDRSLQNIIWILRFYLCRIPVGNCSVLYLVFQIHNS